MSAAPKLKPYQADVIDRMAAEIAAVHQLGACAAFELLDEIRRHHPQIADDLDRRLSKYLDRLTPQLLRAIGGDRSPALPMHAVSGRSR